MNVLSAAPSVAVCLTSWASWTSERPRTAGNCEAVGAVAAVRSSTAGGWALAAPVVPSGPAFTEAGEDGVDLEDADLEDEFA